MASKPMTGGHTHEVTVSPLGGDDGNNNNNTSGVNVVSAGNYTITTSRDDHENIHTNYHQPHHRNNHNHHHYNHNRRSRDRSAHHRSDVTANLYTAVSAGHHNHYNELVPPGYESSIASGALCPTPTEMSDPPPPFPPPPSPPSRCSSAMTSSSMASRSFRHHHHHTVTAKRHHNSHHYHHHHRSCQHHHRNQGNYNSLNSGSLSGVGGGPERYLTGASSTEPNSSTLDSV